MRQPRFSRAILRLVPRIDALESCSDLSADEADSALASADSLKALLARCAEVARNGEGVVNVLAVVARLSRGEAPWLEGDVRAELTPEGDDRTVLALYTDLGFGLRERLVPPTTFPVAFAELAQAVSLAPALIEPLQARREDRRLVLGRQVSELSEAPPPAFDIGPSSAPGRPSGQPTVPPIAPPTSGVRGDVGTAPPEEAPHSRPTTRVSLVEIEALLEQAKSRSGRP